MRPVTTRQISSSNILRQYHQDTSIYDVLPSSSLVTSKTISLPFTYYHTSSIRSSRTNFEQISAWLNDSRTHSRSSQQEPSISLSSIELDQLGKCKCLSLSLSQSENIYLTMRDDILCVGFHLFFLSRRD